MATETVSPVANQPVEQSGTLGVFANKHLDDLYDVVALLTAAAERINDAAPVKQSEEGDAMHQTLRLVLMANAKVTKFADLMFEES